MKAHVNKTFGNNIKLLDKFRLYNSWRSKNIQLLLNEIITN